MRLLGSKSLPDLRKIFDEENRVKDGWYPDKDTWPRGRFDEANLQFGEWNEVELSHAEILNVKLHWNKELGIPQDGMTVAEALKLDLVRAWIGTDTGKVFPESHIWLATAPLKNSSAVEYGFLKDHHGHPILLDGLHRLLAWAASDKQTTSAFIAGTLRKYAKIEDRIKITNLPSLDGFADVVLLFRHDEVILQIGNDRSKWRKLSPQWEEGFDLTDSGV